MGSGVEWALHCCVLLHWSELDAVPVARLAAFHDLPAAYLNKQLQALARAGIVTSGSGPRGGFRLARAPDRITLMDVVVAIEGSEAAFQCTEIRTQGPTAPSAFDAPCSIAVAMRRAELAWRRELARQTLADVADAASRSTPGAPERARRWFSST